MTRKERANIRKRLCNYFLLMREVEDLKKDLKGFDPKEEAYNQLQSSLNNSGCKSNKISDPVYNIYLSIERLEKIYKKTISQKIDELEAKQEEVDLITKCLSFLTPIERRVIYHRFALGIFWADLPAYIDYEQSQCTRIEVEALNKIYNFINMVNNGKPTYDKM